MVFSGIASTTFTGNTIGTVIVGSASGGTAPYTYQWYRSLTPLFTPGAGNIVAGATSLTLNDTGLTNGVTYYYKNVVTDNLSQKATSNQTVISPITPASFLTSPTAGLRTNAPGVGFNTGVDGGYYSGVREVIPGTFTSDMFAPGQLPSGSGTVTTVSVASANGLAGSVATPTTTPAITLSTTVTGVLKGNATAISAATPGMDYQAPISLTTTGTSGASTFSGNTLNVPQYTSGTGTVTSMSVVSANGLAGSVANPTTTPAVTLSTTVTGILKGNSTAISAASAGTDYQAPISLTTTGSSGAATFAGNILNVPQYSGGGSGTVTTTGSPASGNLTKFSGATSIVNGDLSGDISTSGSLVTTLPTVNSNVGSFTLSSITVNAKGLITAASSGTAVTSVATGTGLTGGPITGTGTISMATNTANTLAGFSNTGAFSDVAIGSNLTLSSGTLNTGTAVNNLTSNQNALLLLGGANTPGASAAIPAFNSYDSAAIFGGASGIRTLPTSGTITGEYWHNGNWTQTGVITSNRARIHIKGTMTINNTWTVATEMSGGAASVATGAANTGTGGMGVGLAAGEAASGGLGPTGIQGGGGGGHGGVGGNGGCALAGLSPFGGGTYPLESLLSGSGGSAGGSFNTNAGAAGGNGGGSLYIEATGNIVCTSACAMTAAGADGGAVSASTTGGGGAGSGGGIQMRTFGTFNLAASGSITAPGGAGGASSGASGTGGGGGGGGIIDISSSATTNSGTITATHGNGGAGGAGGAAGGNGADGIVNLNSFVQNVRSSN